MVVDARRSAAPRDRPCGGDLDVDVAIVGGGLHRTVDRARAPASRPDLARRASSRRTSAASARRVATAAGPRPSSRSATRASSRATASTPSPTSATSSTTPSPRSARRRADDGIDARLRPRRHADLRAHRASRSRGCATSVDVGARPRRRPRTTSRWLERRRRCERTARVDGRPRRHVLAALRAHPPRAPRARSRRRRSSAAGRDDLREHRGHARSCPGTRRAEPQVVTVARHRARRLRRARDRGVHPDPAAASVARSCRSTRLMIATEPLSPGVLGRGRLRRATRRSPTTATSSSTASAPPTTGSPSAVAARRTTSARPSSRASTATSEVFAQLESTLHELFPTLDAEVTHRWGGPLAMPRDQSPVGRRRLRRRGLAAAGGYTGDGVVLSHVARDRAGRPDRRPRRRHRRAPACPSCTGAPGAGSRAAALARHQRRAAPGRAGPTAAEEAGGDGATASRWLRPLLD